MLFKLLNIPIEYILVSPCKAGPPPAALQIPSPCLVDFTKIPSQKVHLDQDRLRWHKWRTPFKDTLSRMVPIRKSSELTVARFWIGMLYSCKNSEMLQLYSHPSPLVVQTTIMMVNLIQNTESSICFHSPTRSTQLSQQKLFSGGPESFISKLPSDGPQLRVLVNCQWINILWRKKIDRMRSVIRFPHIRA
jgi:hypothetical protein